MKRIIVAIGSAAFILLVLGTGQAIAAVPTPKFACSKPTIHVVDQQLRATAGCKLGTQKVPAKYIKYSWQTKGADLSGSACQYGTAHGTGTQANLPVPPQGVFGVPAGPLLPARYSAAFTVTARWKGRMAKAVGQYAPKANPGSKVLCGSPPKVSVVRTEVSKGCFWGSSPTQSGGILKAGTSIICEVPGSCSTMALPVDANPPFVMMGWGVICDDGTTAKVLLQFYFRESGTIECKRGFLGTSSLPLNPSWGPGFLYLRADILSYDSSGTQIAFTSPSAVPSNTWSSSDWFATNGSVDPCSTNH